MSALVFTRDAFQVVQALPGLDERETCFVCYVNQAGKRNGFGERYLVREAEVVPEDAYAIRSRVAASLHPNFLVSISNKARKLGCGVVIGHTHPGEFMSAEFSPIDDEGEVELSKYFFGRLPNEVHLAVVVAQSGMSCRILGALEQVSIQVVGPTVSLADPDLTLLERGQMNDRQIRAFGVEGQVRIQQLRVAIVGLGGTGSITAHLLAYLGVVDFLLIDYDNVDESNLNRLSGAIPADVGKTKIEIATRSIKAIRPEAGVEAILGDVVDDSIASHIKDVDFIFLCTDSHASRAVVNQIAYQYFIPCIDMGVSIVVEAGKGVSYVTGRVQLLAPGMACLTCTNALSADEIRREMMTPEQRRLDPYFIGHHEPQPAVISLNATVSSLAVTMFLGMVTSIPIESRFVIYDGIRGSVRPTVKSPEVNCIVCSQQGAFARGDTWPLPVRKGNAIS